MLDRTSISLEKVLGQTIDCEYRAMATSVVVVSRPYWGLWLIYFGLFCVFGLVFARSATHFPLPFLDRSLPFV